ncbi:MAG TPA: transcriptional regulator NrdR [Chloroflexota bacterium]|jgi:transcriptional repressor NrdR|nr:transcriptional regulator NrdR [Chloroflexota bacterium]
MKCPFCSFHDTRVVDSRDAEGGESIRRRRECPECSQRFSTYERRSLSIMVIKKDGRREEFDRQKLVNNIWKACEKRQLAVQAVEDIARDIEHRISRSGATEVPSSLVGEYAMEGLRGLDEIAYIRFASVYKEFADLNEMRGELEKIGR